MGGEVDVMSAPAVRLKPDTTSVAGALLVASLVIGTVVDRVSQLLGLAGLAGLIIRRPS
jgi:hypothetical protein